MIALGGRETLLRLRQGYHVTLEAGSDRLEVAKVPELTDEERQRCREAAEDPEWGLCASLLKIVDRLTGERFLEGEGAE